ncbi:hypothetical protein [Streptomyces wuyuanensis]|uniref:hypothetical protein n=1 Tax=Streptomyces wuyuanensis TaxID=1196353 RepID=UPI0037188907
MVHGARTVNDVMTKPVVAVAPETTSKDIAAALDRWEVTVEHQLALSRACSSAWGERAGNAEGALRRS